MSPPENSSKSRSRDTTSDALAAIMASLPTQRRQLANDNEADLVLQFQDSYIMVSSKILSNASSVFKKWLGPESSGQDFRSANDPQWMEMSSDVSAVHMKFLCALLHGYRLSSDYPDTVGEPAVLSLLDGMATVAKKFRAVGYLSDNISPKLLQPFAKRLSRTDRDHHQRAFDRDAQLAKIAYLLEQEAMLSLFTRRLTLDHCTPLSYMKPSIAKAFERGLLLKLEEKRAEAITIIDFKIRQTCTRTCRYCPITTYIPSIIAAIGNNLSPKIALWPPRYDRYSIRQILIALHSLGRFRASEGYDFQFCPHHRNLTVEAKADFRKVAKDASRLMLGAYYSCKPDDEHHRSDCVHLEAVRDFVERVDPLE